MMQWEYMHFNKLREVLALDNILDKLKDFECQPSLPPHDPAIQIFRASYRGSSSPLVGIVSILSRLFPPHVGKIGELLFRATTYAVAIITAAIAIICRPSPRASSSQQRRAQGSPSTSPPLLSLNFASSSYSLRLVRSSSSLAHRTIIPAPPSSSRCSPWWTSPSPTAILMTATVHSTSTARSPQDRRRKDNIAMPAKAMECSRVPSAMNPYSQLLLVCGHPTLTGAAGLTLNLRCTCNRNNDAPKQSARSRAIWWCQQLC